MIDETEDRYFADLYSAVRNGFDKNAVVKKALSLATSMQLVALRDEVSLHIDLMQNELAYRKMATLEENVTDYDSVKRLKDALAYVRSDLQAIKRQLDTSRLHDGERFRFLAMQTAVLNLYQEVSKDRTSLKSKEALDAVLKIGAKVAARKENSR